MQLIFSRMQNLEALREPEHKGGPQKHERGQGLFPSDGPECWAGSKVSQSTSQSRNGCIESWVIQNTGSSSPDFSINQAVEKGSIPETQTNEVRTRRDSKAKVP